jgi:hypothetical protein
VKISNLLAYQQQFLLTGFVRESVCERADAVGAHEGSDRLRE